MNTALAIFVKTPGLSALKTRLAGGIGDTQAKQFHTLSAAAVAEVARAAMPTVAPYWAVAEQAAQRHAMWQTFPTIWQGDGNLGARMDYVYRTLLATHDRVLLIGADAPQVRAALLRNAVSALENPRTPFVLGPASDGGFWLFGGRAPIAGHAWRAPHYSTASAASELCATLQPARAIATLSTLSDVDTIDDLDALVTALDELDDPLPAQQRLREWLRTLHQPTRQTETRA